MRTLSIRLDAEQAEALDAMAAVEGRDRVELIREAIEQMIERARNDGDFQARRKAALERYAGMLDRLAQDQGVEAQPAAASSAELQTA